jgi:hypothetical protein
LTIDVVAASSLDIFTAQDTHGKTDEHPELPPDVQFQSTARRASQPAADGQQWDNVGTAWQTPGITFTATDGSPPEDAVGVTMDLWTSVFGWGTGDIQLKNELTTQNGDTVLVLKDFDTLYMAAPMIGVGG